MTQRGEHSTTFVQSKFGREYYSQKLALLLIGIIFSYSLLKVGIISLSWAYSFEEAMVLKYAKTPLLHEFMTDLNISLSQERYQLARWLSPLLFLSFLMLTVLLYKRQKRWLSRLTIVCKFLLLQICATWKSYRELSDLQKIFLHLVLLSSLAIHIFLVFYLPPHVDELETYYVFVKEGFVWTSIFYPFPNNHVFFNYFFWLSNHLIDDPLLAARIPSVIFYQVLLLLVFFGVRRYLKNTEAAFGSILLCIALFPSGIYGSEGRGYILFSILLLVSIYALFIAMENKHWQKQALSVFVVSSALGAYTIPVFLLPFISMLLLTGISMLRNPDRLFIKRLMISVLMVGATVGFLYLPIFLFSGVEPMVANKYIQPNTAGNFYSYISPIATAEILSYLAAVPSKGWLIWLILGGLGIKVIVKSNDRTRNWLILTALMVLTIILYGLLMRSFMYERTTTYTVYLLYPAAILILGYYVNRLAHPVIKRVLYGVWLCTLPVIGYFQYQHNTYEGSMLPNIHSDMILKYNRIAVDKGWSVYFSGTSWSLQFIVMSYQYWSEVHEKNTLVVPDYQKADLVVVDTEIFESDTFARQQYQQVEEILRYPQNFKGFKICLKEGTKIPL